MPLIIAGSGPILIVTFLDDSNESARLHDGHPPVIRESVATSPGIIRKAGVLAALAALTSEGQGPEQFTLAVEADRHSGSLALEHWLERNGRRFSTALCEAVDLPVPTPVLYASAAGRMTITVTIERLEREVEDIFGGVVSDLGHQIALIIASLKSADSEIALPGYYDNVQPPTNADIDSLDALAPAIEDWLRDLSDTPPHALAARHNTLAFFFAPSIVVRSVSVVESSPFLASSASATLDVYLVPGQHPPSVLRAVTTRVKSIAPHGRVSASVVRPPVVGQLRDRVEQVNGPLMAPIAPGNSPAGLLEERGTPTLGYAVVDRRSSGAAESVDLNRIVAGAELIRDVASALDSRG
jgi:acetylornithine deacetylase/succinyl-diaminopimelate desuccinylase-like protein